MRFATVIATLAVCFATRAEAAGFRFIDIPAEANAPAIHGAIWYPCAAPPREIDLRRNILLGVKDCPVSGDKLPLVVISHGRGGSLIGHHDTTEALADAGFAVAAINHPGDNFSDKSGVGLSVYVDRPNHIKRLIDFMLGTSPLAAHIDAERVGFFGFSRGGYTGLVLIGAAPDWSAATPLCAEQTSLTCRQVREKDFPAQPTTDPRIKAAVIADPLSVFFRARSFADVKLPVQLWGSERGGDGVEPAAVAAVNAGLPAPHEFHLVPDSAHFAFLAPCSAALAAEVPEICTDEPGFDRAAFHAEFDAAVVQFFRSHL